MRQFVYIDNNGDEIEHTINHVGDQFWIYKGKLHRCDGPAVSYSAGKKIWFQHGICHREDGPAIIFPNGLERWFYHGEHVDCYSQKEFERLLKLKVFW
jgi:hypothetical protein